MKKNTTTLLVTLNIVLILILILKFSLNVKEYNQCIVYVDNSKIFENFNMTKELKRNGEKEFNYRKATLDSLYSKLQSAEISDSDKKNLTQLFVQQKEDLHNFNDYFASEQSSKIWKRIKSYSAEFSKENNYKIIVGSEDRGSVLFADENIDVTNDLLSFINKKYEGLK